MRFAGTTRARKGPAEERARATFAVRANGARLGPQPREGRHTVKHEPRFPAVSTAGYHADWLDIEVSAGRLASELQVLSERAGVLRETLDCFAFEEAPPPQLADLERYVMLLEQVSRGITALSMTTHAEAMRRAAMEASDDGDE